MLKKIAPETYKKISKQKGKVLPAISIGSVSAFLSFIPLTFGNTSTIIGISLIGIGYALVIFFIILFGTVCHLLGITKTLFDDYSKMPAIVHWLIVLGAMASVLTVSYYKVMFAIKESEVRK